MAGVRKREECDLQQGWGKPNGPSMANATC